MVALVTGASDGIGREVAKLLSAKKCTVYCISRTMPDISGVRFIQADVSSGESVKNAVEQIILEAKKIDIVITSAGVSMASPADLTNSKDSRYLFDVNFWGSVNTVSHALAHMRKRKRGRIIFISSMTALLPVPYLSYYCCSKSALLSFACSLSAEMKPFGIKVSAVLPGGVRTDFSGKRKKYWQYAAQPAAPGLRKAIEKITEEEQTGLHAREVAEKILSLILSKNPPVVFPIGGIYRAYCIAKRLLPSRLMLFILRKKY